MKSADIGQRPRKHGVFGDVPNGTKLAESIKHEYGGLLKAFPRPDFRVPRDCETMDGPVSLDLSLEAVEEVVDEVLKRPADAIIGT